MTASETRAATHESVRCTQRSPCGRIPRITRHPSLYVAEWPPSIRILPRPGQRGRGSEVLPLASVVVAQDAHPGHLRCASADVAVHWLAPRKIVGRKLWFEIAPPPCERSHALKHTASTIISRCAQRSSLWPHILKHALATIILRGVQNGRHDWSK